MCVFVACGCGGVVGGWWFVVVVWWVLQHRVFAPVLAATLAMARACWLAGRSN